jgi:hypothetical protein
MVAAEVHIAASIEYGYIPQPVVVGREEAHHG